MSWWVYLEDNETGESVTVGRHSEGGIYALGGITDAELNITYNYSAHYHHTIPGGLRGLDGVKADKAAPLLRRAVEQLGTERGDDYWEPTSGNAGYALSILLRWAEENPGAVFRVS